MGSCYGVCVGTVKLILDVVELAAICGTLQITIPPAKLGKKSLIYNLVSRYINSEDVEDSDDQGLALFTQLDVELKTLLSIRVKNETTPQTVQTGAEVVTGEVTAGGAGDTSRNNMASNIASLTTSTPTHNTVGSGATGFNMMAGSHGAAMGGNVGNSGFGGGASNCSRGLGGGPGATVALNNQNVSADGSVRVRLTKLQEFKIHGGFVASGDSPISYSNLKYQMEEGEANGYEVKEIMAGVIRAIKPNSKLRNFLESSGLMAKDMFLKHIRNHYDLQDSDTVLTKLSDTVQGPTEKVKDYILGMMDLRNNVMTLAREEGFPIDPGMVRRRFLKGIGTGLREDTIRLEVQALLNSQPTITDDDLSEKVKLIVERDAAHKKKMENSTKTSTNALNVNRKDPVMVELSKISARVDEIAATKNDEVIALQHQMQEIQQQNQNHGYGIQSQGGTYGTVYYDDGFGYADPYGGNAKFFPHSDGLLQARRAPPG